MAGVPGTPAPPPADGRARVARAGPRGPGHDPAVWRAIADFVYAKGGEMRPRYALLCAMYWLQHEHGCAAVSAADLKAILPRLGDAVAGRMRSPADTLRRVRDEGLAETLGAGAYRLTPLGAAVVGALPDAAQVGAMRGLGFARCRRRAPGTLGGRSARVPGAA